MAILGGILESFDGTGDTVIVIPATSAAAYEPLYLLSQIKTVDGSGSDLDADLLDGYHSSHFGTAAQVTSLQNTDISLQSQINNLFAVGSRLVYRENFTGDGISNVFTLNGTLQNAGYTTGSWSSANILTALQADITDLNGKPIYDSVIPIYRDRINVSTISPLGTVTLDFIPLAGQQFSIWYWYQLTSSDVLSFYYREDHVAEMEAEGITVASSVDVNATFFGNIVLRTTDNTVQKALDRLDDVVESLALISGNNQGQDTTLRAEVEQISGSLQSQINSINIVAGSNVSVVESPVNTWTISATISGGSGNGFTPYSGTGVNVTPSGSNYTFSLDTTYTDNRYVNVTGDTMTGNLSFSGGSIRLDTALANPPYQEGRVFYDNTEKALSYYTDINGVTVNVGQEHLIKVRNVNGSPLADGDVVYVFSANGDNVTVKKARADIAATSRATIGVVTQACADNASTYITRLGKVHGLNTNAYNEGDTVYLSHTVAGGWTTTLPPAPNRTVRVGYITKKSGGDGHILVDIHDGLSLTEVNDVWITSATNRDLLSYNSGASRWENTSVVAATSGALDSRYTLLSTTASISGNLQSQINSKADYNDTLKYSVTSGIIAGGILSINVDNTKFNVSAGRGIIVDNWTDIDNPIVYEVSWGDIVGISAEYLAASTLSHIGVDRNGNIIQRPTEETNEQRRDIIMIGSLGHTNNLNIANANPQYCVAVSPIEQYRDLLNEFRFINNGIKVSPNGSNLKINVSEGTLFGQGINYLINPKDPHRRHYNALSQATFQYRTQTGITSVNTTDIVPNVYDVAGSLTAVPGASTVATNQRIYMFPNGNIRIQYGQTVYNTLTDAALSIQDEQFVTYVNIEQGAVLLGELSVIKGATNLNDPEQARFFNASKLGENLGGSAAIKLDDYALLSTVGEITGNFQAQINLKTNIGHTHTSTDITDFNEAVYDNIATNGMLVAGANITFNYDDINNQLTINSGTGTTSVSGMALLQGEVSCDTINNLYVITHIPIDKNYSYPVVNLEVPTSGSNLFIQGITNRTASSFSVVLSEVPNTTGYKILWHLPTSNPNVIGTAVVNQQITSLPSFTTSVSGNYNVGFTDTVVYIDSNSVAVLPSTPIANEHHWIVNTYSSDITISGNGKLITKFGYADIQIESGNTVHIHFNSTKDRWYIL